MATPLSPSIPSARLPDALFRLIVEHAQDLVSVVDSATQVCFVSPSCQRILGLSERDLLGRPALDFLHPADRPAAALMLRMAALEPGRCHQLRFRHIHADGSYRVLEGVGTAAATGTGEPLGVIHSRDVTEAERWESECKSLHVALERAQRLEAIGTLAGGIAHDFNNILQSILGNVEAMQLEAPPADDPRPELAAIGHSVERARKLIRRLLMAGRRDDGVRQEVDLGMVVAEAERLAQVSVPAGADLRVRHAPAPCVVIGDFDQLLQVALNLMINAAQALEGKAAGSQGLVAVDYGHLPDGRVRLRVADDGAGMDRRTLERIYEPFFSTKPVGRGTGLGLAVVHGIVGAHGGSVRVHSRPGRGSVFTVFLPRNARTERRVPAAPSRPARILLTGGNPPRLARLEDALASLGHSVIRVRDPAQAMDLLRREADPCDLILLDCPGDDERCRQWASLLVARSGQHPLLRICGCCLRSAAASPEGSRVRLLPSSWSLADLDQAITDAWRAA